MALNEADTCRVHVTPKLQGSGWETLPYSIAVAQTKDAGRVGSHRFIACVPESGVTTAEFLCFYLLTEEGIEKIREASPDGAGRSRTLGLKNWKRSKSPSQPTKSSSGSTACNNKVAAIQQAQTDNQTELDALLPSILDRAFKGEL